MLMVTENQKAKIKYINEVKYWQISNNFFVMG